MCRCPKPGLPPTWWPRPYPGVEADDVAVKDRDARSRIDVDQSLFDLTYLRQPGQEDDHITTPVVCTS